MVWLACVWVHGCQFLRCCLLFILLLLLLLLFFLQPGFAYIAQAGLSPSLLNAGVAHSMHPLVLVYFY